MSFNAKDMTQGGQIASMRIRMFSQIANIIFYCLFIFFWILVGLVLWVKLSWQTFVNGCIYWWCTTLEGMRDLIKSQPVYEIRYYGQTFRMNAAQVLQDKYTVWCGEQLWSAFVLAACVALVVCLMTFFVVTWILGRQGKQQSEDDVTGGRQLTDNPKDVARMLKKDGKASDIRIGDLPIIKDSEIQNFLLHGTVGAGKSEVIRRLGEMAECLERSRGWIMRLALSAWLAQEDERDRLTREALAEVETGQVIDHQSVQAWAESLDTERYPVNGNKVNQPGAVGCIPAV